MTGFVETVLLTLSRVDLRAVIDILIVAAILYWILALIQGTTAVALIRGMVTVILFFAILGSVFDVSQTESAEERAARGDAEERTEQRAEVAHPVAPQYAPASDDGFTDLFRG